MDVELVERVQLELDKTKIALMSKPDSTFFISICFSLKHLFSEKIPTACTDGLTITFNPHFFLEQSKEVRVSVLLHETMHCAYLHMARLQDRNMIKANCAADYVINLQLYKAGFEIPNTWLLRDDQNGNKLFNDYGKHAYDGMSMEQIYNLLPEDQGAPMMSDLVENVEMESEQLQSEMTEILIRAKMQSEMSNDKPGTIPGDLEIFLDGLLNPKLPWTRILKRYLQVFNKTKYSFQRPNKRFFPEYYLPKLYGKTLVDLAIAVDASGSTIDAFTHFISEISGIFRMAKPKNITLLLFDTEIKSVSKLKNLSDLMNVKFTGLGGTDIDPVIKWANEHKPQLLLVFSDGGFHFHDIVTKVNTVWLIHNLPKFKAPFGNVINYEIPIT